MTTDTTDASATPDAEADRDAPEPTATAAGEDDLTGFPLERFKNEKLLLKAMKHARRIGRRAALYKALARASADLPLLHADRKVDFTARGGSRVKFRYTSLGLIAETINPVLLREGLGVNFRTKNNRIICELFHSSGGRIRSWLRVPETEDTKSLAAELRMRRRYLLLAILNLAVDEDDDDERLAPHERRPNRSSGHPQGERRTTNGRRTNATPSTSGNERRNAHEPNAEGGRAGRETQPGEPQETAAQGTKGDSDALRKALSRLGPGQAAELRRQYSNNPQQLLQEAEKLASLRQPRTKKNTDKATPTRHEPSARPVLERIENAFEALKMASDKRKALERQYAGQPSALLEHLKRVHRKRESAGGTG